MIFDVMVREGYNVNGKQVVKVYRVHDSKLNEMLRSIQDAERYILSVIPLFRQKREEVIDKDKEYAIANGIVGRSFLIKKGEPIDIEKESLDDVLEFNKGGQAYVKTMGLSLDIIKADVEDK